MNFELITLVLVATLLGQSSSYPVESTFDYESLYPYEEGGTGNGTEQNDTESLYPQDEDGQYPASILPDQSEAELVSRLPEKHQHNGSSIQVARGAESGDPPSNTRSEECGFCHYEDWWASGDDSPDLSFKLDWDPVFANSSPVTEAGIEQDATGVDSFRGRPIDPNELIPLVDNKTTVDDGDLRLQHIDQGFTTTTTTTTTTTKPFITSTSTSDLLSTTTTTPSTSSSTTTSTQISREEEKEEEPSTTSTTSTTTTSTTLSTTSTTSTTTPLFDVTMNNTSHNPLPGEGEVANSTLYEIHEEPGVTINVTRTLYTSPITWLCLFLVVSLVVIGLCYANFVLSWKCVKICLKCCTIFSRSPEDNLPNVSYHSQQSNQPHQSSHHQNQPPPYHSQQSNQPHQSSHHQNQPPLIFCTPRQSRQQCEHPPHHQAQHHSQRHIQPHPQQTQPSTLSRPKTLHIPRQDRILRSILNTRAPLAQPEQIEMGELGARAPKGNQGGGACGKDSEGKAQQSGACGEPEKGGKKIGNGNEEGEVFVRENQDKVQEAGACGGADQKKEKKLGASAAKGNQGSGACGKEGEDKVQEAGACGGAEQKREKKEDENISRFVVRPVRSVYPMTYKNFNKSE